jgi:hypothetical protein
MLHLPSSRPSPRRGQCPIVRVENLETRRLFATLTVAPTGFVDPTSTFEVSIPTRRPNDGLNTAHAHNAGVTTWDPS